MAGSTMVDISQIRKGMEIHASDGVKLGTIAEVWVGTDPIDSTAQCDEDVCSRLEVHEDHQRAGPLYIPYNALAAVLGHAVTLNVDAATAHARTWHHRPSWLPEEDPGGIMVTTYHEGLAQFRTVSMRPPRRKQDNV